MTERFVSAQEDNSPPGQSRPSSQKHPAADVHNGTFTRTPRLSASSVLTAGLEATPRSPRRLSVAATARERPLSPSTTPQKNSSATLQTAKDGGRSVRHTHSPPNQVQASPSTIFSTTIQDLERLLNEALHIARVAADDHDEAELPTSVPQSVDASTPLQNHDLAAHGGGVKADPGGQPSLPSHKLFSVPQGVSTAEGSRQSNKQDTVKACDPVHPGSPESESSIANPQIPYVMQRDWAEPLGRRKSLQRIGEPARLSAPASASVSLKEPLDHILRRKASKQDLPRQDHVAKKARRSIHIPTLPRSTSRHYKRLKGSEDDIGTAFELENMSRHQEEAASAHGDPSPISDVDTADRFKEMFGLESSHGGSPSAGPKHSQHIDLNGCRHVDVKGLHDFNVHHTWKHQPVARDWEISRKRFAATIACINTLLIGVIVGIYAGEVPAIQYVIVDLGHLTILGNVVLYIGLAIPTLLLWPLPLMHGRKPYTIMALAIALCLQIPQGIAVSDSRSPHIPTYRRVLLLSRAVSGFALGFVNINLQATLLDLFGASLQSSNPHQETVDLYDVRRHGGGMGLWLGLWSWCSVGSISIGFFIGTLVVDNADVAWGFWISLMLMMVVLLLNVIGPEARRSAYRRTVAEVMRDGGHINRVSRGEVKMHLKSAGPYWWGEEVKAGIELSWKMFRQPGFAVLAVYIGWTYSHFTLILMLLGALTSKQYRYRPVHVGLCVLSLGTGALLATPFQKASFFSRARRHRQRTDSMTFQKSVVWSSHLVRRAIFTLLLPFAGVGYALASRGPTISVALPTVFAGCVGFLSNLAIAECQGLIMEAFDTSDLQPGMIGRPTRRTTSREREQRTNFSCYPRVSAGFAVSQSLSFCFAAIATGVCGRVERRLGAMQATGVVAGVLLGLTLLLTTVLFRFRVVRMIPDPRPTIDSMTRTKAGWEPVVLGRPSGTTRKISILEAGKLTRWSEIRRRNRLTW